MHMAVDLDISSRSGSEKHQGEAIITCQTALPFPRLFVH